MNMMNLFAYISNEAEFTDAVKTVKNCLAKVEKLTDAVKTDADKKPALAVAQQELKDAKAVAVEFVTDAYESYITDTATPVEAMKRFIADPFCPHLVTKVKNAQVNWLNSANAKEAQVYDMTAIISAIIESFGDEGKAYANTVKDAMHDARMMTSGYVLHEALGADAKQYKSVFASEFGCVEMFESAEGKGRKAAERSMQSVFDALMGKNENGKQYIHATKTWILEMYLFDHGFERSKADASVYIVPVDQFVNRITAKMFLSFTNACETLKTKK